MEEKNQLYITISDKRGGSGEIPVPQPNTTTQKESEKDNNLLSRYAEHELFHLVKDTATRSVNFALSNIGNFTGDYITQKNVNVAKQVASSMMNIGFSTLAGAKFGPVGAVIGFTVGVASVVSSSIFDDISMKVEVAKTNYNIEQLRDRVGLNSIYDNSRGTEN